MRYLIKSIALSLAVILFCSIRAKGEDEISLLEKAGISVHGFADARGGVRSGEDEHQRDVIMGETRVQVDLERMGDYTAWRVRSDFVYDDVADDPEQDLEVGTGRIDLREANVIISSDAPIDIKLGRQILTWGTGDLLFVNDMFPKDWQSFFIGRDEEYLKAPSDAVMMSAFPSFANIDLVYTPRFDADRYISGERISFWNPMLGAKSGRDDVVDAERRDDWLNDCELAGRISKKIPGYEFAVYGYDGFEKSPGSFNEETGRVAFSRLRVYGASMVSQFGGGLLSAEGGYYDSISDREGDNPAVPNCQTRYLLGYERELWRDFTARFQYYVELMSDYDRYLSSLQDTSTAKDEDRHLLTLRCTKLAMNQNMTLSLFIYYSPSDEDSYLRPIAKYKISDAWMVTLGGNVFLGEEDHTFFGQFEDNSNIYAGIRCSF